MCSCGSLHGSLKLAMHRSRCNCRVFVVVVVVVVLFVYLFSLMYFLLLPELRLCYPSPHPPSSIDCCMYCYQSLVFGTTRLITSSRLCLSPPYPPVLNLVIFSHSVLSFFHLTVTFSLIFFTYFTFTFIFLSFLHYC